MPQIVISFATRLLNKPTFRSLRITLTIAGIFMPATAGAFVTAVVNYGAPTADEQLAFDKINRFRANPQNELATMFSESFAGTYSNADMQGFLQGMDWSTNFWKSTFGTNIASSSMDFFQTRPGTIYSQFESLTSAPALGWSNNIGWAAHQYAVWVERDAGVTPNPHAIPGAPSLGARFTNAGVSWTNVGENIAANWQMNVAWMHMGYAVDWGFGPDGIQSPPGHRNSMLSATYNQIGVGIVNDGWGATHFTNVQHFAATIGNQPIVYGFVTDQDSQRLAGATVEIFDAAQALIGTVTTDAIGAYTYRVPTGRTPALAAYSIGLFNSPAFTLGNANGNWFLDVQLIPEPSTAVASLAGLFLLCIRRREMPVVGV